MEFTELRVSTMTSSAALCGDVDLDALFDGIVVVPDDGETVGIWHAINWHRTCVKPEGAAFIKSKFGMNVSVRLRLESGTANMKIFRNGGLQMTGIKTEESGREAAHLVAGIVHGLGLIEQSAAVDFRVRMINSDLRANRGLRRSQLYEAWRQEKDICITFDPMTYPALKLMFFYAPNRPVGDQDGVCRCPAHCSTKLQAKYRKCLKVTVSLFESGCIIITGSIREEHARAVKDLVTAKLLAWQDTAPPGPDAVMRAMLEEHRSGKTPHHAL